MAFVTAAVIAGGAALAGGALAANAAKSAAGKQAAAAQNAADMTERQFNITNQQQAPYRQAGYQGLNKLSYLLGLGNNIDPSTQQPIDWNAVSKDPALQPYLKSIGQTPEKWAQYAFQDNPQYGTDYNHLQQVNARIGNGINIAQYTGTSNGTNNAGAASAGIPSAGSMQSIGSPQSQDNSGGYGSLLHQFNASDLNANLAPSYQFMLNQGRGALENAATRSGGLLAGNTLQGLNKFTQDYASTGYQQAYNNFTNNQNNIYNRLAGIAGIGQGANTLTANAGAAAAGNAGNYLVGGANATAAGQIGSANAINQGLSNAAGWGYLGGSRPMSGGGAVNIPDTVFGS